jgi:hypothetical protein
MHSNSAFDRETIMAAVDRLEAAHDVMASLAFDALTNPEVLAVLSRLEAVYRRQPVVEHRLIGRLAREASPIELGGTSLANVLATRLRISGTDARRRIAVAEDLGPRTAITGEPLAPRLPKTAAAQEAGQIGGEHVRIIQGFFTHLPAAVDATTREAAEADLARMATQFGPEHLRKCAERLAALLDQDGTLTDADRARRRGVTIGRQGSDGMSPISGLLDPEARATLDAVLAKLAAPGMCNPDDQSPCVDGAPSEAAIQGDSRSPAQRNHDALKAAARALLASGQLGQHNGLPVTVIVSTTLKELESGCGQAVTGGGTLLPMSDLIRLASHSHHYLTVFDHHTRLPLYLGRSRRTASPGQRIVLHAKDRGCTFPGCTVPGYFCEVHHVDDWADGGPTDIDKLTFTCGPNHRLIKPGGWTTRKRKDGITEWIPPPHLDWGHLPLAGDGQARTNYYHHPDRFLTNDDEDTG